MSRKSYENLEELILCVDIGTDPATDLVRWVRPNSTVFRMDILNARETAKPNVYLHVEKANHRTVYTKNQDIIFTIMADVSVQYQLLEAILESMIENFLDSYGELIHGFLTGMTNMFAGYLPMIPKSFIVARDEKIHWISAFCNICNRKHSVCVKKSLIIKAPKYPVSIVYNHEGHGLLIYLDGDFKVRGQEVVEITG